MVFQLLLRRNTTKKFHQNLVEFLLLFGKSAFYPNGLEMTEKNIHKICFYGALTKKLITLSPEIRFFFQKWLKMTGMSYFTKLQNDFFKFDFC